MDPLDNDDPSDIEDSDTDEECLFCGLSLKDFEDMETDDDSDEDAKRRCVMCGQVIIITTAPVEEDPVLQQP